MSETLYAIAERYREVLGMEATTDDERAALVNALDSMEGEFTEKVENVVRYIRNCEADTDTLRAEEIRLATKRQALTKKAENLTAYIEAMMMMTGKREIKAGIFDLKFAKNPPSIIVINEADIPREYFIAPEPVLSKSALRDAVKAGEVIPGIEVKQQERLKIK